MVQKNMTPAERVKAALNHTEPDRIPLDLGSTKMTGINIKAYINFIKYKGWEQLDNNPQILDTAQQLACVQEEVLRKLLVDTRGLLPQPPSNYNMAYAEDGNYVKFTDEWGITWRKPINNGYYFDMMSHPLAGPITINDLKSYQWPDPLDEARTANFRGSIDNAKKLDDSAFLLFGVCAGVFEMALRLRGFEQLFMDLVFDPRLVCEILDRIVEIKMAYWQKALQRVGKDVIVAVEGDDVGTQNSLMISPEMYREFIKPRHKRLFSFIKEKAPHVKVFLHSCGAVKQLIPDFIEAGVDILNPIQVSAKDMDTKILKKEFGDALTFWGGGVDTQKILPFGTPQEVRDEVRRRIDDLAPGGGFIFNTIHNIQADVPPENIEAMLDTLKEYGKY